MSRIRVLIIDDSAFARKVLREVLAQDPGIEVIGHARDGLEGLEKIAELKPDVVTLDLIMPELDGIGVLKALRNIEAPKVIVVSVSGSETDLAIEALQLGAFDLIGKPTALATGRLYELAEELLGKVKAAAISKLAHASHRILPPRTAKQIHSISANEISTKLLVIGTSTGGPQAITELFKKLPAQLPFPILIALHIPAGYTAPLAARISQTSAVPLAEASHGLRLLPGHAYIAPGGMHLRVRESSGDLYAVVSHEPSDSIHHPSVDELFSSAAEETGAGCLGLIMTGMGNDGTAGAGKIRSRGGRIIAESEISCVVFGMPRAAMEAGAVNAEAPLEDLVSLMLQMASAKAVLTEGKL